MHLKSLKINWQSLPGEHRFLRRLCHSRASRIRGRNRNSYPFWKWFSDVALCRIPEALNGAPQRRGGRSKPRANAFGRSWKPGTDLPRFLSFQVRIWYSSSPSRGWNRQIGLFQVWVWGRQPLRSGFGGNLQGRGSSCRWCGVDAASRWRRWDCRGDARPSARAGCRLNFLDII